MRKYNIVHTTKTHYFILFFLWTRNIKSRNQLKASEKKTNDGDKGRITDALGRKWYQTKGKTCKKLLRKNIDGSIISVIKEQC